MDQKFFHGNLNHAELARALAQQFNRGNMQARIYQEAERSVVELSTRNQRTSGGRTSLTVILQNHQDGVGVSLGQQDYLGVAASLGTSALRMLRNPLSILGRLDDVAQDIQYLQLSEEIWRTVEKEMRLRSATTQVSERLRRDTCPYCSVPNAPGSNACIACGAPLAELIPQTCQRCGYVLRSADPACPNCGQARESAAIATRPSG